MFDRPRHRKRVVLVIAGAQVLLGFVGARTVAAGGVITTFAGVSPAGYSGDGGPASEARMNEPRMLTFDRAGSMYITDTFNHLIRKVDPGGVITTVAGKFTGFVPRSRASCTPRFGGDGGPATEATLSCPHSVAISPAGELFIADSANHVIRKVDSQGIITTVAGQGGKAGFAGDGGLATQARLKGPKGIIFDPSGNLLIADSGNNRVRRIGVDGMITTIVGTGDQASGGDGGPASDARLTEPRTLALGPRGSLYIAEPEAHRVRRVDPQGTIATFAGTGRAGYSGDDGPAIQAELNMPRGVGTDGAGNVYIADSLNQRIRVVDRSGVITSVAGRGTPCYYSANNTCGDGGPPQQAGFAVPRAIDVDAAGNLYIADTFNERIRRVDDAAVGKVQS
jgi:sugar lactone lactonase YvrE